MLLKQSAISGISQCGDGTGIFCGRSCMPCAEPTILTRLPKETSILTMDVIQCFFDQPPPEHLRLSRLQPWSGTPKAQSTTWSTQLDPTHCENDIVRFLASYSVLHLTPQHPTPSSASAVSIQFHGTRSTIITSIFAQYCPSNLSPSSPFVINLDVHRAAAIPVGAPGITPRPGRRAAVSGQLESTSSSSYDLARRSGIDSVPWTRLAIRAPWIVPLRPAFPPVHLARSH